MHCALYVFYEANKDDYYYYIKPSITYNLWCIRYNSYIMRISSPYISRIYLKSNVNLTKNNIIVYFYLTVESEYKRNLVNHLHNIY